MTRRHAAIGLLALAALAALLYLAIRQTRDLTDFEVYRTAGTRLLHAEPLYRAEDGHFVFKYLPAFAFGVVPFAVMGPDAAKVAWFALTFALLVWFVAESIRALPGRRRALGPLVALTLVVIARVAIRELSLGQTNVLLGALFVASFRATTRGARGLAGTLVGLATFVKPYAILLAPWLAATVGAGALTAAFAAIAAGLALPAVVYGWSGNLSLVVEWFRTVTETTAPNMLLPENISIVSAWAKWIGAGPVAAALAVVTVLGLIGLAAFVLRRRGPVSSPAYLEFALLLLLIPLLTPQGWDYMLLLGTPAILCLLDRWREFGRPWQALVAAALVLIALPMREVLGLSITRQVMGAGILTVAALVLVAALVDLRLRRAA
jgi:hypothetical protein